MQPSAQPPGVMPLAPQGGPPMPSQGQPGQINPAMFLHMLSQGGGMPFSPQQGMQQRPVPPMQMNPGAMQPGMGGQRPFDRPTPQDYFRGNAPPQGFMGGQGIQPQLANLGQALQARGFAPVLQPMRRAGNTKPGVTK